MTKIARFSGDLQAFGSAATGTERTVFGDIVQSDTLNDNINTDFLAGWENGLDVNDFPPQQYFNAVGFTATLLAAYLHQMGIAEYDAAQEYHIGSLVNVSGDVYKSLVDANIGNAVSDITKWLTITHVSEESIAGKYAGSLTTAIASIGATEVTLLIDTLVTLTQNDTVPDNITLRKTRAGKFTGAYILTINGGITGDLISQWFDSTVTVAGDLWRITPQMWGVVPSVDSSTEMQRVLTFLLTNKAILVIPKNTYKFDSALTWLRSSSGDEKRFIVKGNGSLFDFTGMGTSGDALKIGATASGFAADDGEIRVNDLAVLGPESANPTSGTLTSPTAPDGTTVGLRLEYALNVSLEDVVIKRFYSGLSRKWVFPLTTKNLSLHQNYINEYVEDVNTLATHINPSFKEGRYGVVMYPLYNEGSISAQTYIVPHFEDNHVGCVIWNSQRGTDGADTEAQWYMRGITFDNPYVASNDGDVFRIGIPWTFANPDSRGIATEEAVNILSELRIIGGHWSYSYSGSGTLKAPIVFDSGVAEVDAVPKTWGSVHGAYIKGAFDIAHIVGLPRNTVIETSPRQDAANFNPHDNVIHHYDSDGVLDLERTEDTDRVSWKYSSFGIYDATEVLPTFVKKVITLDLTTPATGFGVWTIPANYTFYPLTAQFRADTAITATTGNYLGLGVRLNNRRVDFGFSEAAAASSTHAKNTKFRFSGGGIGSSEGVNGNIGAEGSVIQLLSVTNTTDAAGDGSVMGGSGEQATVVLTGWLVPNLEDAP